jgi:hypothetical protein
MACDVGLPHSAALPVLASADEAMLKAKTFALRAIAGEIEYGEMKPTAGLVQFSIAA